MSEDVKPKLYYVYKGRAYEIHNGRSLLEDVLAPIDKFNMKTIELEPTLQLMKEMGEVIRGHDCLKGSAYFDGEDRTITECTSCDVLEKYRKFLEGISK